MVVLVIVVVVLIQVLIIILVIIKLLLVFLRVVIVTTDVGVVVPIARLEQDSPLPAHADLLAMSSIPRAKRLREQVGVDTIPKTRVPHLGLADAVVREISFLEIKFKIFSTF